MTQIMNQGIQVELQEDGEHSLAFETPLEGLEFAEIVFREARKSALMQQVTIIDGNDLKFGKIGRISAVERDTVDLQLLVTFGSLEGKERMYHLDQIQLI